MPKAPEIKSSENYIQRNASEVQFKKSAIDVRALDKEDSNLLKVLPKDSHWKRVPSAKDILMKQHDKGVYAANIAFDLESHRSKRDSEHSSRSSQVPTHIFEDNNAVDEFVKLGVQQQYQFKIDIKQFDEKLAVKLPYVFENDRLHRLSIEESKRTGFWHKLHLTGSG